MFIIMLNNFIEVILIIYDAKFKKSPLEKITYLYMYSE